MNKNHETKYGTDFIFFIRKRTRSNNTKEEDNENICVGICNNRLIDALKMDLSETEY